MDTTWQLLRGKSNYTDVPVDRYDPFSPPLPFRATMTAEERLECIARLSPDRFYVGGRLTLMGSAARHHVTSTLADIDQLQGLVASLQPGNDAVLTKFRALQKSKSDAWQALVRDINPAAYRKKAQDE